MIIQIGDFTFTRNINAPASWTLDLLAFRTNLRLSTKEVARSLRELRAKEVARPLRELRAKEVARLLRELRAKA